MTRSETAHRVLIGLLAIAFGSGQRMAAEPPRLDQVLARAGTYVAQLHARLSGLVAEETYVQQIRPTTSRMTRPPELSRRTLKGDLLLVSPAGSLRYLEFRDIFEVDGAPVRDRQERLTKLFLEPSATSERQIKAILDESARYNIGGVFRNINTPMLAMSFLSPGAQARFKFRRLPARMLPDHESATQNDEVLRTSAEAWTIGFEEVGRPTAVRTNVGRDLPVSGRFWLDPASGAVLMSELVADNGTVGATITVSFRFEPQFGLFLPVEMRERYESSGETINGIATYGRFRQFLVHTKETIQTDLRHELGTAPELRQPRAFDLQTSSVQDIQDAVAAGALTYERLIQLYQARIDAYNTRGPRLSAIIHINPKAVAEARALDEERQRSGLRSPLHGIPIAVKDNVDTADMPTTGGNIAFAGTHPPHDATIVTKLRAAGAIVFLKTNMDEFAMGSQGLSTLGGQTLNVFDVRRSPGGSSGGTAVAVAAGFATLGIATETGLSTRGPASNAALVGLVPTRGLISRAGIIPLSFTQDRVGIHARSVGDAETLLTILKGFDVEDLQTSAALETDTSGTSANDRRARTAPLRVGVLRELFPAAPEAAPAITLVERALSQLRARANTTLVEDLTTTLDLPSLIPSLRLNNYEVRFAFDAYLRRRGPSSPVTSLAELITSGKYLKDLDSRYDVAMKVQSLDIDVEYRRRLDLQRRVRAALLALMDRERLDALAYPTKSLTAPPVGESEVGGPRDNPFSAVAGLPAVVMPVGLHPDGLPIAIEFLGRPFDEGTLLELAGAYERLRGPRPLPPTTPRLVGEVLSYAKQ